MLLIGTPCYAGTVSVPYLTSLLATIRHCEQDGIEVELQHLAGESLLPRARNLIANAFFRRQEFSHLLLIDPDLGFPADAAVRYLRSGRDVVCGLPPLPRLDVNRLRALARDIPDEAAVAASLPYPFAPRPGAVPDGSGLLPVAYGPAAFMAYEINHTQRLIEDADALTAKLDVERNTLITPARLRELAKQYNLGPARPGQIRRVNTAGQVEAPVGADEAKSQVAATASIPPVGQIRAKRKR